MEKEKRKRPVTTVTFKPEILERAIDIGKEFHGGKSEYIETLLLADFKRRERKQPASDKN
jgi:hypothetical protein